MCSEECLVLPVLQEYHTFRKVKVKMQFSSSSIKHLTTKMHMIVEIYLQVTGKIPNSPVEYDAGCALDLKSVEER